MKTIQILGTGCPKCRRLAEVVDDAAKALGLDCTIEKVTDLSRINEFGVMVTPALAVDGQVKLVGRVPSLEQARAILGQAESVITPPGTP